jgi:LuxR family maltose regulon positive regulatory protein
VVVRPRLLAQLTTAPAGCVLIAAPAGWGKTLLASSWLTEGATDSVVAWISLSPIDDDLRGFWTSVAAALIPKVGDLAAAALRNAVMDDDLEQVPGKVAAALAADGAPIVLVLDNLHEVTELAVHESLLRLVQRPPRGLRLVVTTRRDPPWPLSLLRMAGVLSEIRASDLAFGADETRALLDQLGIDLDAVHVGRLVARTEGWAAGLRLAALELHNTPDPAGFVDGFSGDDHAVAAYLLDQVIDRLSPALLDFLVRVSILDVVSADLADAMTGGSGGRSTLAELARSNLFVQAVGTSGRWFRLHRLIPDVLRTRITRPGPSATSIGGPPSGTCTRRCRSRPSAMRCAARCGHSPRSSWACTSSRSRSGAIPGRSTCSWQRCPGRSCSAIPSSLPLSRPRASTTARQPRSGSWPPRPWRVRAASHAHAQSGSASS